MSTGAAQGDGTATTTASGSRRDIKLAAKVTCWVSGKRHARTELARPEVHEQLITQARDEQLRIMKDNRNWEGARGEARAARLYCTQATRPCRVLGAGDRLVLLCQ